MKASAGLRTAAKTCLLFFGSGMAALLMGEVVVRAAIPVRNVGPTFSEYDPLYGKRLKKNFHCTRTAAEFSMRFSTNSLGLRGPEHETFPSGGILFLGDSFTSGYGVNDGEEFPELVRRHLVSNGISLPVVNAGSGNTGNGYWLHFLQKEARRFSPRLLILGFCKNDYTDNVVEGLYSLDPEGTLRSCQNLPGQGTARRVQELIEAIPGLAYSHLVGLARQAFSESASGPGFTDTSSDRLTWTILEEVFSECDRQGLPSLLLTVDVDGMRLAKMRRLASRHGIPVLVTPSKKERPDLYYHVDDHWNASGHAYVAREIIQHIPHELEGRQ